MPTMRRKDFDEELAAWLADVHAEQSVSELDQLADLWIANGDAKAIKDAKSPASREVHERINGILDGMGY
jgi:hypothetical protein